MDNVNVQSSIENFICNACNKSFTNKNSLHGHKAWCKLHLAYIKNLKETILTKEFLYENLVINNFSANHIALNIVTQPELMNAGMIINRAKELGIPTKSAKESNNLKATRDKFKKTCMEKYGAENWLSAVFSLASAAAPWGFQSRSKALR
jgi:hypothetical protein